MYQNIIFDGFLADYPSQLHGIAIRYVRRMLELGIFEFAHSTFIKVALEAKTSLCLLIYEEMRSFFIIKHIPSTGYRCKNILKTLM